MPNSVDVLLASFTAAEVVSEALTRLILLSRLAEIDQILLLMDCRIPGLDLEAVRKLLSSARDGYLAHLDELDARR